MAASLAAFSVLALRWPDRRVAVVRAFAAELALVLGLYALVAHRRLAVGAAHRRGPGPRPGDLARRAAPADAQRARPAARRARPPGAGAGGQPLLRRGPRARHHRPAAVARSFATATSTRGCATSWPWSTGACLLVQLVPVAPPRLVPGTRLRRHRPPLRAVRLHRGGDGGERPALGHALAARGLGGAGRRGGGAAQHQPVALAGARPPGADHPGGGPHRQPLVARRRRGGRLAGPGGAGRPHGPLLARSPLGAAGAGLGAPARARGGRRRGPRVRSARGARARSRCRCGPDRTVSATVLLIVAGSPPAGAAALRTVPRRPGPRCRRGRCGRCGRRRR